MNKTQTSNQLISPDGVDVQVVAESGGSCEGGASVKDGPEDDIGGGGHIVQGSMMRDDASDVLGKYLHKNVFEKAGLCLTGLKRSHVL